MLEILIQQRHSYEEEIAKLEAQRKEAIEKELEVYRQSLEQKYDRTQIEKLGNIVSALDDVIEFESTRSNQPVCYEEPKTEAVYQAPADSTIHSNKRAGMADVFAPIRG